MLQVPTRDKYPLKANIVFHLANFTQKSRLAMVNCDMNRGLGIPKNRNFLDRFSADVLSHQPQGCNAKYENVNFSIQIAKG